MEQLIHFLFLHFDCFRCHQNHVFILFHHVICSKVVDCGFKLTKSSQKTRSQDSFLCWKEGWTWVSFYLLAGFNLSSLKIYIDSFWVLRDQSVQWRRPFFLGGQRVRSFLGPVPSWTLRLKHHLPSSPGFHPSLLQWELAEHTLPHFFIFHFFNSGHQTQLSHSSPFSSSKYCFVFIQPPLWSTYYVSDTGRHWQ